MSSSGFVGTFADGVTPGLQGAGDAWRMAQRKLPKRVFDFIEGGAGRGVAASENLLAFDQVKLRQRLSFRSGTASQNTVLFGELHDQPFGIAPLALSAIVDPRADKSLAMASKWGRIPVCASSSGSSKLEDMLEWSDGRAWFQLYGQPMESATDALVERAQKAGYRVLVVTVDPVQTTERELRLRNGISTLPRPSDFLSRPAWAWRRTTSGPMRRVNLSAEDSNTGWSAVSMEYLSRLRDRWKGRLVIKGISDPEDAMRLKELGIDGVYVSTSGGRQFDSGQASLDTIWDIRGAIGSTMGLVFDGGARNGEDIVKALALGADMVMMGRPLLYALGADGPRGLATYLDLVSKEVAAAMAHVGCLAVGEIQPRCLLDPPPVRMSDASIRLVEPTPDAG